jgi:transposase
MAIAEVSDLRIENLDHLGIIAGVVDRIGLVGRLDARLGSSPDEIISSGGVVKAMILNGLGFVSAPLYLFSNFFEGKPCEHLLGEGIKAEHLNDDKLGRVLDKLFEAGLTSLFVELSLAAAQQEGVETERVHLDSTSLSVHGAYEGSEDSAISITYGYSRDKRPDLKQFLVDLMVSGDGGIPVFLRVADGNESDQKVFTELIQSYLEEVELDTLFVADAALYSEENLQALAGLRWVSRVPETITAAKELLEGDLENSLEQAEQKGYRLAEQLSSYGDAPQRWVVVESASRVRNASAQVGKRVKRERKKLDKALRSLKRRKFNCEKDAQLAVTQLSKGMTYHQLSDSTLSAEAYRERPGRPRKGEAPLYRYLVKAKLARNEEAIARHQRRAGRFLLATSVLDAEAFTTEEVLSDYLSQQLAERGFRFLKDPLFFTSSVFLKTPERVAALAMVMGLSLLVYSLAERELRTSLSEQNAFVADQKGKPTKRPTMRWIFQVFQAVHLVLAGAIKHIHGLTQEKKHILSFFSPECRQYYLLL